MRRTAAISVVSVGMALCLFALATAPGSGMAQAPAGWEDAGGAEAVSAEVAEKALAEALRFADVTYEVGGRVEQGVAYLFGGRTGVDEYVQAVAQGKRPGVDVGADASGVVVLAYRAADPAIRFMVREGGEVRFVRDVGSAELYRWNVRTVPVEELRPGDLIFFKNERGGVAGVAVFERRDGPNVHFVVASANAGKVIRTFLNVENEYWKTRFLAAGQLLRYAP